MVEVYSERERSKGKGEGIGGMTMTLTLKAVRFLISKRRVRNVLLV